ncbi:MAG: substrate-binding domain-containing protein [Pseudomonadota bacterium]
MPHAITARQAHAYCKRGWQGQPCTLARHLVHLGHERICVISGITKDNDRTTMRLEGIRAELLRHGVELRDSMVAERAYSISDGRNACELLFSRNNPPPTAIICGNDVLALGALIECTAKGMDIPGDTSVVGFDNLEFATHSNPPLTTIDVPAEQMGADAAGYALGVLSGDEVNMHNSVEVQMILRNSSAPPKKLIAARPKQIAYQLTYRCNQPVDNAVYAL